MLKNFGLKMNINSELYYYGDFEEVNGTNYNEKKALYIKLRRGLAQNKGRAYFAFFDKETYSRIRPQLTKKSLSKKDKVSIIIQNTNDPICYSGEWDCFKYFRCTFNLSKDGTLLVLSIEPNRTLFLFSIPFFYVPSSQHILNVILYILYPFVFVFLFISVFIGITLFCQRVEEKEKERLKRKFFQLFYKYD